MNLRRLKKLVRKLNREIWYYNRHSNLSDSIVLNYLKEIREGKENPLSRIFKVFCKRNRIEDKSNMNQLLDEMILIREGRKTKW